MARLLSQLSGSKVMSSVHAPGEDIIILECTGEGRPRALSACGMLDKKFYVTNIYESPPRSLQEGDTNAYQKGPEEAS